MADAEFQLINGDGVFNSDGLQRFTKAIGLHGVGDAYGVVSIIGPQNNGKSTLLNHLFGTSFKLMDESKEMSQTTQGIWLAGSVGTEPLTMIMDVEGSDGQERKGDTTFEKQSALFALATADVLLFNMKCDNIGLQNGAGVPLLRTVIEVMMRLVNNPRKTTLMFVLRDKNKIPFEMHKKKVKEIMHEIWNSIEKKPEKYASISYADVFNVEVVALSHYNLQKNEFEMEVADLRNKICGLLSGGGGSQRDPSSVFVGKLKLLWDKIKENKDLDLPSISVLASKHRCEEIANERCRNLGSDKEWVDLKKKAQKQLVEGFGEKLSSLIKTCMEGYDKDAEYLDDVVKSERRKDLVKDVLQLVNPTYQSILEHLRGKSIGDFKTNFDEAIVNGKKEIAAASEDCKQSTLSKFDEGCADAAISVDAFRDAGLETEKERQELKSKIEAAIKEAGLESSKERENLEDQIKEHVTSAVCEDTLNTHKEQLKSKLQDPVKKYLRAGDDTTWSSITKLLKQELKFARGSLSRDLDLCGIDKNRKGIKFEDLKTHAHKVVVDISRSEANHHLVLKDMTQKFDEVFVGDIESEAESKRVPSEELIREAAARAHRAAVKLLAVRAAIPLDHGSNDAIESILFEHLMQGQALPHNWAMVSETLLQPTKCEFLCSEFKSKTEAAIDETIDNMDLVKIGTIGAAGIASLGTIGAIGATAAIAAPAALPLLGQLPELHLYMLK